MSESVSETRDARQEERSTDAHDKMTWETPQMEDVSEQVMAQPYIRFT
ncbi:hypothetical protein [Rhodovibrio sodomensis]|nr:hypothetical protein [Rhodovibrio sodomensis]